MLWSDREVSDTSHFRMRLQLFVKNKSRMFLWRVGLSIYWVMKLSSMKRFSSLADSLMVPVSGFDSSCCHFMSGRLKSPIMIKSQLNSYIEFMFLWMNFSSFSKLVIVVPGGR